MVGSALLVRATYHKTPALGAKGPPERCVAAVGEVRLDGMRFDGMRFDGMAERATQEGVPNLEAGELRQQVAEVGVQVHGVLEMPNCPRRATRRARGARRAKPGSTARRRAARARRPRKQCHPSRFRVVARHAPRRSTCLSAYQNAEQRPRRALVSLGDEQRQLPEQGQPRASRRDARDVRRASGPSAGEGALRELEAENGGGSTRPVSIPGLSFVEWADRCFLSTLRASPAHSCSCRP